MADSVVSFIISGLLRSDVWKRNLKSLNDAAKKGNINDLYAIVEKTPFILEKIDEVPFINTPLHFAVMEGKTSFVAEIANLKPSFARKLNQDGFSPLHMVNLAPENKRVQIVKELLKIDPELCLVKGREKMTPLHCAAMAGNIHVLGELLSVRPDSIEELTVGRETALHLAGKYGNSDALELLEVQLNQIKMDDLLNSKDNEGKTAKDLLKDHVSNGVRQIFRTGTEPRRPPDRPSTWMDRFRLQREVPQELLVVAVLIATVTFQLGVSPPGAVWQDNSIITSSSGKSHIAGTAILATRSLSFYLTFLFFNTGTFLMSMSLINLLITEFPFVKIYTSFMVITYVFSVISVLPMGGARDRLPIVAPILIPLAIPIVIFLFLMLPRVAMYLILTVIKKMCCRDG